MTGLLYFQPFDHRGSFQTKLFAWEGKLTQEQAAQIAASKVVIYDGSEAAVAGGVPKEMAGILEQKKLKRDNSFWPIKHLVPGPFSFPHVLLCALLSSCSSPSQLIIGSSNTG